MSAEWLRTTLTNLYRAQIDSLEQVIRDCPENLWTASVWDVRLTDRHVWPIVRGMGEDLPDAERLQLHSAFCNVAYHVLFFLDHYLSGGLGEPRPPEPFRGDEQDAHVLPRRAYAREDLLAFLEHCRRKAQAVLELVDDAEFERPARIGRPLGDLLVNNLLQLNEHAVQLSLFLNWKAGWSDPRWTPADRWFRRCPHCPPEVG